MFSIEQASKISGIDQASLRTWIASGFIHPSRRGARGRGQAHQFSFQQVMALTVGQELRQSERGCSLHYLRDIVEAFSRISEDSFVEQFKRRYTHFNGLENGLIYFGGWSPEAPSIVAAYHKTKEWSPNGQSSKTRHLEKIRS